jgi:hypothetical protein
VAVLEDPSASVVSSLESVVRASASVALACPRVSAAVVSPSDASS